VIVVAAIGLLVAGSLVLLRGAGTVAVQPRLSMSDSSTPFPSAANQALMNVYNARPDLQAAYPDAASNVSNYSGLVSWAGVTVTGLTGDGAAVALEPYGYYYDLMWIYNDRPDLQAAFPDAYTNFTNYTELVTWAGETVSGFSPDGAATILQPYGYYYDLMWIYNVRPDLQAAFPDAYTNFTNYTELVTWAGETASGASTDGASVILGAYSYYYDLMWIYNDRPDLQAAYPNAYSSLASYSQLVDWAGGLVSGQFSDGALTILNTTGGYYALMWVYNVRPDLQAAYLDAYSSSASYAGLVQWANDVVTKVFTDGAYSILYPFASSY